MQNERPQDSVDLKTNDSANFQKGQLAWGCLFLGIVSGAFLLAAGNLDSIPGMVKAVAGVALIATSFFFAHRFWTCA